MGTPLLGSLGVLALRKARRVAWVQGIALVTSVVCVGLVLLLYQGFDPAQSGLQFQEDWVWIRTWNIRYAVGIDGISLPFVLLTVGISLLVILSGMREIGPQLAQYLAAFLMIEGLVIGSFIARDALLFYIFWEAVLIPMMLCIGIWGSTKRAFAALKFFMITFLGSAPMLLALLYLGHFSGSFDFLIRNFYELRLNIHEQIGLFFAFLLAFSVKIPLWPVHTWLPDAHTEAPAEGSVILAALMLKMGGYGLLRFVLPIVPDACQLFADRLCGLALVAIIYIGLTALVQQDMKRLIAYSSIAHMGMVVLGIFLIFPMQRRWPNHDSMAIIAVQGAMLHMISHAFSAGALFFAVGMIYKRFHSRLIHEYSGLAQALPSLAAFFMLFTMSNIGLPGTAGFVGEFLIVLSAMKTHFGLSFLAATTLILSASYTLWLYKRLFWGPLIHPPALVISSLHRIEQVILGGLAFFILLIGLWPVPLFEMMQETLKSIVQLSMQSRL